MTRAAARRTGSGMPGAAAMCGVLLVAALVLGGIGLARQVPPGAWWPTLLWPDPARVAEVVAADSLLPRLAAALLAGAALGLAGALLQAVLRNRLASPDTVGIAAGSQLALSAATLFAPGLLAAVGRDVVALAGGGAAVAAVLGLGWAGRLAPATVLLAGLAVSLYAGALGTALALLHTRQLAGLFLWGSGSMVQLGWGVPGHLAAVLAAGGVATAVLARPLRLLDLPDDVARGLGLPVPLVRLAGLSVAVGLGGSVVSLVGVVGFVGLGAPALVRLTGGGRAGPGLSALAGAGLLAATDGLVQLGAGVSAVPLPTGAVTALLGAPLLLALLPWAATPDVVSADIAVPRPRAAAVPLLAFGVCLVALAVGAALVGNSRGGWTVGTAMLPLRLPRVVAAATGGAMLAVAGTVLQRILRNPVASPDVLGLTTGTMLGVMAALWAGTEGLAGIGGTTRLLAAAAGAAGTLALLLAFARGGARPGHMLLAGLALGTAFDALLAVLLASGSPVAEAVLTAMSGSTYGVDAAFAAAAAGVAVVLVAATLCVSRWLDLLPLGDEVARAVGLHPGRARTVLLLVVGGLTGTATLLVGPLSFVGLMAPHGARLAGLSRPVPQLLGAALGGAAIMVAADWAGRTVLFPSEIPAGLVAAVLGGPLLFRALARRP